MANPMTIYRDVAALAPLMGKFKAKAAVTVAGRPSGLCGFDGFIDTFVRLQTPDSMAEFGPKVAAAAGIAASYPVRHLGDKFGGNGPLFAAALNDIHAGNIDVTYIGAMGRGEVMPIYQEALRGKTKRLYTLAQPAHTTCLEFTDGKVMLCDMAACAEVTWERVLECVGQSALDAKLKAAAFISAVNWGKLPHAGPIWSNLAARLAKLDRPAKEVFFFMDLAEFETQPFAGDHEPVSNPAFVQPERGVADGRGFWRCLSRPQGCRFRGGTCGVPELSHRGGSHHHSSQRRRCLRQCRRHGLCAGPILPPAADLDGRGRQFWRRLSGRRAPRI